MSVAPSWTRSSYQRIASARVDADLLVVHFEDGTCAGVALHDLLPSPTSKPDWSRMKVGRFEIVVPTSAGEVEVSWSGLRAISDPVYAAHLARAAEDRARTVGRRVQALREARGMALETLARRAGLDSTTVADVEAGRRTVPLALIGRLVEALGGSLRDLADPD